MVIRALWATPRTVSTAFERMVIERGDQLVLDEPWSRAFYLGPERRSGRFPLCFPEATYDAVTAGVLGVGDGPDVFVKDMAYQAEPGLSDEALSQITHTFLIRRPDDALASLGRRWPDHSEVEAGYDAQLVLFERIRAVTGTDPVVVDSDDLRTDAPRVVAAWCAAVGLDHRPEALTWEPGMRPEWPLWTDWYENVAASSGFAPPGAPRTDPASPAVDADLLARAEAAYRTLSRYRVALG